MGSTASALGSSAKNLALALAMAPPQGMKGSEAQLLSLRSALFEAAQAAARAAILQHLKAPCCWVLLVLVGAAGGMCPMDFPRNFDRQGVVGRVVARIDMINVSSGVFGTP